MNPKCQVCGTVLDPEGEGVRICPTCKSTSHDECWNHLGGCIQPECRKAAKASKGATRSVSEGRLSALIRRRLSWIVAQEMKMSPDYHPDERRYSFGAAACVVLAAGAEAWELELAFQIFGPSTLLLVGLLALHRRQRRLGYIHRWIPAGSAPQRALDIADWILFVEEGGELGRPLERFGEDFLHTRREMDMLEDARRLGVLETRTVDGDKKMMLGELGQKFLEEARSRAAPAEIGRSGES